MVGVGPAVNTNYRSPPGVGWKSPIYMFSLPLSGSVHPAWLALRLNGNPPRVRIPQCKGDTGKRSL